MTKTREENARLELKKKFVTVDSFNEGLAGVYNGTVEFHVKIDGTPAYAERYAYVGPFRHGLAWVRTRKGPDGREFHIRPDGTRAYRAEFSTVSSFDASGKATATVNHVEFLIDRNGNKI